mmetsp:Transcript_11146/g.32329  ORF Transcript_11146/g.32329 Transcript_11146/m.32329 type:complete len:108 (-) Transcript_11146:171-494(-)
MDGWMDGREQADHQQTERQARVSDRQQRAGCGQHSGMLKLSAEWSAKRCSQSSGDEEDGWMDGGQLRLATVGGCKRHKATKTVALSLAADQPAMYLIVQHGRPTVTH